MQQTRDVRVHANPASSIAHRRRNKYVAKIFRTAKTLLFIQNFFQVSPHDIMWVISNLRIWWSLLLYPFFLFQPIRNFCCFLLLDNFFQPRILLLLFVLVCTNWFLRFNAFLDFICMFKARKFFKVTENCPSKLFANGNNWLCDNSVHDSLVTRWHLITCLGLR